VTGCHVSCSIIHAFRSCFYLTVLTSRIEFKSDMNTFRFCVESRRIFVDSKIEFSSKIRQTALDCMNYRSFVDLRDGADL
jgi:hypothetical protein